MPASRAPFRGRAQLGRARASLRRCNFANSRLILARRPEGGGHSERGDQVEWLTFEEARARYPDANPTIWRTLGEVYEGASESERKALNFCRASYGFGDYVLRCGRAFAPGNFELPNALRHPTIRCPLAMVINSKFEVIDKESVVLQRENKEDARIFHGLTEAVIPVGGFIGLFECLDYALSAKGPSTQHWTISAGARNFYPMFMPLPLGKDDKELVRKAFPKRAVNYDSVMQPYEFLSALDDIKSVCASWSAELLYFSPAWPERIKAIKENTDADSAVAALLALLDKGWVAEAKVRTAGPTFMDALYELGGIEDAEILYACAWLLQIADEVLSSRRPCYAYVPNDDTLGPFSTIEKDLLGALKRPQRILRPYYLDEVNVGYLPLTSISGRYFIADPGNHLRYVNEWIGRAMQGAANGNPQGGRIGHGESCRRLPVLDNDELFKNLTFRVPNFDKPSKKAPAMRTLRIDPRGKSIHDAMSDAAFFEPAFAAEDTTPNRGFFKACMRFHLPPEARP